jgi:hypothetical protein
MQQAFSQTTEDVIMMNKYQWCNGINYNYSQWNNYWEGTFKRDNANIGTVTNQSVMIMTNYGVSNNINVMASIPYVFTKASAGTLHGLKGFQDISFAVKWKAITKSFAKGKLSFFAVEELSTPSSNYVIDFLPMSIGLGSTNLTSKLMANYVKGIFNVRLSGAYVLRSNVKLDRTSYYTTSMHYTNEVEMPNTANFNIAFGIHKKYVIANAVLYNMTTLGGFDMRKNDMPFVSNKMNSTSIGADVKYTLPSNTHLSFFGAANYVIAGRNIGQSTGFTVGCFYAGYLKHSSKISTKK